MAKSEIDTNDLAKAEVMDRAGSMQATNIMSMDDTPDRITAAAITIADYFGSQGYGNKWQYLGICARGNAYALEEIESSPEGLDSIRLTYFQDHNRDFQYINSVSICGKYPCWSVNSPAVSGRRHFKSLRDAIDFRRDPAKP